MVVYGRLVIRERTPIELMLYAIYLYLSGLSLRQTARTLASIGVKRSREAVRKWVHRFGELAIRYISRETASVAIVDETAVNVGGRLVWLWVAVEPERRTLIALHLSETRNILVAYSFLSALRRRGVKRVITDGANWYPVATRWARLEHSVVRGGVRNYIECFICTVKDRLRAVDVYFPSPRRLLKSVLRFIYAWACFYNYARKLVKYSYFS